MTTKNDIERLHGREAIEWARAHGLTLEKYSDPIEHAQSGLSVADAERVAAEDPQLIYLDVAIPCISTREQIEALRAEAGAAGDQAQVERCDHALAGDRVAWADCDAVIADARAQWEG